MCDGAHPSIRHSSANLSSSRSDIAAATSGGDKQASERHLCATNESFNYIDDKTFNMPREANGNNRNVYTPLGRVETDTVHERLREDDVKCPTCDTMIRPTAPAIKAHFGPSHPAGLPDPCVYCNGNQFVYIVFSEDENGEKTIEREVLYHACQHS